MALRPDHGVGLAGCLSPCVFPRSAFLCSGVLQVGFVNFCDADVLVDEAEKVVGEGSETSHLAVNGVLKCFNLHF
jgi:hypothetical protein